MVAPTGATINFVTSGNKVYATIDYNNMKVDSRGNSYNAGYNTTFAIRNNDGVRTFYGDRTFSKAQNAFDAKGTAIKAADGTSIRSIKSGVSHGVNNGLIQRAEAYAIGRGNDPTSQGSRFWAIMGLSTNLSALGGLSARPSFLSSARTVSDILSTKGGKEWWSTNRRAFEGTIDFRQKTSNSYALAKRFLKFK